MFTVITSQLKTSPKVMSKSEAYRVIQNEDPICSADYHLLKELNRVHSKEDYETFAKQTKDVIEMHNDTVKDTDWFLFLGDISEKEISKPEDIAKLYYLIKSLKGRKIMIRGNNENFDDVFYNKCGFEYVETKKYIAFPTLIFSHEPLNLESMGLSSDVLNIHGHLHGSAEYRNMNWKNHADVWFKTTKSIPLRVSQYIELWMQGAYNDSISTYATFARDDIRV